MISFPVSRDFAPGDTFRSQDSLNGVHCRLEDQDGPGSVRVLVDGEPDCLRFYGRKIDNDLNPIIFFEGDAFMRAADGIGWKAWDVYDTLSPHTFQREAEAFAAEAGRTFLNLARPGVLGSTGNHHHRRRPREVYLVHAALDRLKATFGWTRIDLVGLSGGGTVVAALMGLRKDIGRAVIASGNVAIRRRAQARGLQTDVTGFADFIDPIDLVSAVAEHPPGNVIILTDPMDTVVPAAYQSAYCDALRSAGVQVTQRFASAPEPDHHRLRLPAIHAALERA